MAELTFSEICNVFYDGDAIGYPLGGMLREKYKSAQWIGVEKNSLRKPLANFSDFFSVNPDNIYLTVRGREPYYSGNRVSEFSVPFTSSIGYHPRCKGKCFYVCVNREEVMIRLLAESAKNRDCRFEVGEFSDLVAEDRITGNLAWSISEFARGERGFMTFATSFAPHPDVYHVEHKCRTNIRVKVNPDTVVRKYEPLADSIGARIHGINKLYYAGYPCGIMIAPIILGDGWEYLYSELLDVLDATLCDGVKTHGTVEIVFDRTLPILKAKKLEAAEILIKQIMKKLPSMNIIDIR